MLFSVGDLSMCSYTVSLCSFCLFQRDTTRASPCELGCTFTFCKLSDLKYQSHSSPIKEYLQWNILFPEKKRKQEKVALLKISSLQDSVVFLISLPFKNTAWSVLLSYHFQIKPHKWIHQTLEDKTKPKFLVYVTWQIAFHKHQQSVICSEFSF